MLKSLVVYVNILITSPQVNLLLKQCQAANVRLVPNYFILLHIPDSAFKKPAVFQYPQYDLSSLRKDMQPRLHQAVHGQHLRIRLRARRKSPMFSPGPRGTSGSKRRFPREGWNIAVQKFFFCLQFFSLLWYKYMSYTLIQRVALYPDHSMNTKEPSQLVPVVKFQIVEKSPVIWVFECEIDDRLLPQQTSRGESVTWEEWLENASGKAQLTLELHSDLGHFQLELKVHPKSHPSYYCTI